LVADDLQAALFDEIGERGAAGREAEVG